MRVLALVFALGSMTACRTETPAQEPDPPQGQLSDTLSVGGELSMEGESPSSAPAAKPRPENGIFRSEVHRATNGGKPAYLLAQLKPEPYRPRGRREGWVINAVFPDDPGLCSHGCDLYPGDVILTINGNPLERPEHLSDLMGSLDEATKLDVRLIREGKLHQRTYVLVDG